MQQLNWGAAFPFHPIGKYANIDVCN